MIKRTNDLANTTDRNYLTRELKQESGFMRRQELLKALWRLDHQPSNLMDPSSDPARATKRRESPRAVRKVAREQVRTPKTAGDSPTITDTAVIGEKGRIGMSNQTVLQSLNNLYGTLKFSLSTYLRYAKPWGAPGDNWLRKTIRTLGDEQLEDAARVGSLINERRGRLEGGAFPMRFTALNDLSLAYLAPIVLKDQERIVWVLESLATQIGSDPAAHEVALEVLANARSHRDTLREAIGDPKCDVSGSPRVGHASDNGCRKSPSAVVTAA